jgi:hypothetical protein
MRARTPTILLSCLSLAVTAAACDAAVVMEAQGVTPEAQQADVAVAVKNEDVAEIKAPAVEAEVKAEVKVEATIKPEALDLESITFLVKKGKVKDAKALEAKINSPKEKLNDLDLDGDGKIDKIVIVEVKKDDGSIIFELHAVPSKSKKKEEAVIVAHVYFTPDKTTNVLIVKATYAPIFIGYDTIVYDYTVPIVVKGDVIVVDGGGGFYGWLYTSHRPVYYGSFVYVVAPAPVFVIDVHHGWHGMGKWKGKGKHWGGKHGKHGKWH